MVNVLIAKCIFSKKKETKLQSVKQSRHLYVAVCSNHSFLSTEGHDFLKAKVVVKMVKKNALMNMVL